MWPSFRESRLLTSLISSHFISSHPDSAHTKPYSRLTALPLTTPPCPKHPSNSKPKPDLTRDLARPSPILPKPEPVILPDPVRARAEPDPSPPTPTHPDPATRPSEHPTGHPRPRQHIRRPCQGGMMSGQITLRTEASAHSVREDLAVSPSQRPAPCRFTAVLSRSSRCRSRIVPCRSNVVLGVVSLSFRVVPVSFQDVPVSFQWRSRCPSRVVPMPFRVVPGDVRVIRAALMPRR